jgi:hypothetical protein
MMVSRKVAPLEPPRVIAEVGGLVDEWSATFAVYGQDLEPNDVTDLIGLEPSNGFRRGFKRGPISPAMPHDAWLLEVRGVAPDGPARYSRLRPLPRAGGLDRQAAPTRCMHYAREVENDPR